MFAYVCSDHSLVSLVLTNETVAMGRTDSYGAYSPVAFFDAGFLLGSSSRLIRPSSSFVSSHRSTGNLEQSPSYKHESRKRD